MHVQLRPGKGIFRDEYFLENEAEQILHYPDWDWAEWVDEKIHFIRRGQLYEMTIENKKQLSTAKCLHDFNHYTYLRLQAPY